MQFIQLRNVTYTYPAHHSPLFSNISFDIADHEVIALLGNNGSGKTTLIRLLLGELIPVAGTIHYPRTRPVIGYLPQDVFLHTELSVRESLLGEHPAYQSLLAQLKDLSGKESTTQEEAILLSELWEHYYEIGLDQWEKKVDQVLTEMSLSRFAERCSNTLSGGEMTRMMLGKLLLRDPDILIMDEPTNHLDLDQMMWLEAWIRNYRKAVLYVSHDREFINNTATRIASLDKGRLTIVAGNYASFTRDVKNQQAHDQMQYLERKDLIQRLQQAAQKRRGWAKTFQPETRGEGGGFVYESINNAARTMTQQAKHIENRITMLQERFPVQKPFIEKKRNIQFTSTDYPKRTLISCDDVSFRYGDRLLFEQLFLRLEGGDRIWLSGSNGSGKTTLIKLLTGVLQPEGGVITRGSGLRLGIYDQDLTSLPASQTVEQYLKNPGNDDTTIRTVLGCLGVRGEMFQRRIVDLSWGEKAKIQLGKLLLAPYNMLLLDEPTNHLDLAAREMLEEALQSFRGAILFVSHDRAFVDKVATQEFHLSLID